ISFAMFGRFLKNFGGDILLRMALAAVSLVTMLHPDTNVATAVGVVAAAGTLIGIWRYGKIASPKTSTLTPVIGDGPAPKPAVAVNLASEG
ncbi:MAG TPA: hypothetical protein VIG34_10830, partial [Xanthobacteraceae bacterium]